MSHNTLLVFEVTILVLAIFLGIENVVGGFVVTDRMLEMFKSRERPKKPDET
jgi:NAD(P) transhydrogenase subunit alpha